MSEELKEIRDDVKEIRNDIGDIKITMARNTDSLEYHIRRTDILESKVTEVDKHIIVVQGIMRIGTILATLIASAWALIQIYTAFFK